MKQIKGLTLDNRINVFHLFFLGCLLMTSGISIVIAGVELLEILVFLIGIIFIIMGISSGFSVVFPRRGIEEGRKVNLYTGVVNIILGVLVLNFKTVSLAILPICFGLYTIANGAVKLVVFILYYKNKVKHSLLILVECVIFFVYGTVTLFFPLIHIRDIMIIIGTYCILYSFTYFFDGLQEILPAQTKNKIKRGFRISLPVFFVALIPKRALNKVNAYLNYTDMGNGIPDAIPDIEIKKTAEEPDIEVFIHVTEDGFGSIGHVDLAIGNTIISYGNYDIDSLKLFEMVGDGVLFTVQKDKYIPFCIETSKKTLFSFGLKLKEEELKSVERHMAEITKSLYKWDSPYIAAQKKGLDVNLKEYTDYATEIETKLDAKLYKFKDGRFKNYFILGTNCVLLADQVVGRAGTDIVKINGIISPGAYYNCLDLEFRKKGSRVITKRVYN